MADRKDLEMMDKKLIESRRPMTKKEQEQMERVMEGLKKNYPSAYQIMLKKRQKRLGKM